MCRSWASTRQHVRVQGLLQRLLAFAAMCCCGLLAGCASQPSVDASAGSGKSAGDSFVVVSGGASAGSSCSFSSFSLPTDNSNPHGATPQDALNAFLSQGSILGVPPERLYPTSGWILTVSEAGKAIFESGRSQLYVSRVAGDSWVVTGGRRC